MPARAARCVGFHRYRLCPRRRQECQPAMAQRRRSATPQNPQTRRPDGQCRARCSGLHGFSSGSPRQAARHQSHRAPQWRNQTAHQCRGRSACPRTSGRLASLPNEAAITRLIGALIMEQSEEWPKQILTGARTLHVS